MYNEDYNEPVLTEESFAWIRFNSAVEDSEALSSISTIAPLTIVVKSAAIVVASSFIFLYLSEEGLFARTFFAVATSKTVSVKTTGLPVSKKDAKLLPVSITFEALSLIVNVIVELPPSNEVVVLLVKVFALLKSISSKTVKFNSSPLNLSPEE